MSPCLADVLTLRTVHELADARTFARGEAYFQDGAVGLLDADAFEVRAKVQGTRRYSVRLAAGADEELEYECDCPVGDDGTFCNRLEARSRIHVALHESRRDQCGRTALARGLTKRPLVRSEPIDKHPLRFESQDPSHSGMGWEDRQGPAFCLLGLRQCRVHLDLREPPPTGLESSPPTELIVIRVPSQKCRTERFQQRLSEHRGERHRSGELGVREGSPPQCQRVVPGSTHDVTEDLPRRRGDEDPEE